MNVSVLLRLVPGPLAAGRLVGELEVVQTGERALVHSADELVDFLRARALAAAALEHAEPSEGPEP